MFIYFILSEKVKVRFRFRSYYLFYPLWALCQIVVVIFIIKVMTYEYEYDEIKCCCIENKNDLNTYKRKKKCSEEVIKIKTDGQKN